MLYFQTMEEDTKFILQSILALDKDTGSSQLHSDISATAMAMLRRPTVSEQFEKEFKSENSPQPKKKRTFVFHDREMLWKMNEMNDRRFR